MSRLRALLLRRRRRDDGVALVAVVVATAMLSLFLLSSLAYTIQNSQPARRDQDAKTALAAAQAGIDEYLSRLSVDTEYWQRGNVDAGNPALAASGTGRTVPGASTGTASFRYQVLSTPTLVNRTGAIRLQVTGMSSAGAGRPVVSRTLTATLRPRGYLDFIYLSDFEVIDPELTGTNATNCSRYYYPITDTTGTVTQQARGSGCAEIQWITADTVYGPLHSNDALQINGSTTFLDQKVESSWPAIQGVRNARTWWGSKTYPLNANGPCTSTSTGSCSTPPFYAPPIALPEANSELKALTTVGSPSYITGACYYTGATRIIFTGTQMKVYSPNSNSSLTASSCLDKSRRNQEQTVDIPDVVYVDRTTGTCVSAGYPRTDTLAQLLEAYVAGALDDLFAISLGSRVTTNYNCLRGTAYVQGSVHSAVTVATLDDVVVTGNLTLADNGLGTDIVGLVAGSYIWVYHPLTPVTGTEVLSSSQRVTKIQAAILSLRRSFVVQNWNGGQPLGSLTVLGAIAQKFRGPVGTTNSGSGALNSGYSKAYRWDSRLAYLQPPYFLKPKTTPWVLSSVTDQ